MRRNLGLREENEGERETCSGPEARQPPASQSSSEVRYTHGKKGKKPPGKTQVKRNRFRHKKELTRNDYNIRLSKVKISLPAAMWELVGGPKESLLQ